MGVSGAVRCTCYEDGRATPPPVPVRVSSYDELSAVDGSDLREWQQDACEHPGMEIAGLDLGWRFMRSFYAELSASPDVYPVLLGNVPQWNGGWYLSPDEAGRALEELRTFKASHERAAERYLAYEQTLALCLAAVRTNHHVVWG